MKQESVSFVRRLPSILLGSEPAGADARGLLLSLLKGGAEG